MDSLPTPLPPQKPGPSLAGGPALRLRTLWIAWFLAMLFHTDLGLMPLFHGLSPEIESHVDPAQLPAVFGAMLGYFLVPLAALVLVSPSYQGQRAELPALVALAHGRGLPVLVDQAHGRGEALAAGADLVVLSGQKAGGGLAQSAALLLQGPRADRDAVARALLWLQTSSPSALLLASAEAALDDLTSSEGRGRWQAAWRCGERLQRLHLGARLAVFRGVAAGRGQSPAGVHRDGHLWEGDPEPERRAAEAGGAVEVRVQVRQIHREDRFRGQAAPQHLAGDDAPRDRKSTRLNSSHRL